MQTVLENLIAARAVIADREAWCQHARSNTLHIPGHTIRHPFQPERVVQQYCAVGALWVANEECWHFGKPERKVLDLVAEHYFGIRSIVHINDGYCTLFVSSRNNPPVISYLHDAHTNVLFCYDKAIATVTQLLDESRTQFHSKIEEVDLVTL